MAQNPGRAPATDDDTLLRTAGSPLIGNILQGHGAKAAQRWSELGCTYEQAIALSAGDEAAQREALGLFDRLGAVPAAARLRRQLRASGARGVPRGPIATRAGPVGLTARQSERLRC